MRHPVVLRGHILTPSGLHETALGMDPATGLITAVGDTLSGDVTHDFGDHVIAPGGVDIHVHFRDPGHPAKEDFASGTIAAAFGGVTTVFDMPNTDPATTSVAAYDAKRRLVAPKAHVDWGLYGGIVAPGEELRAFARAAPAFKVYLGESTGCVTLADLDALPQVFADLAAARFAGLVAFHAEDRHVMAAAATAHADAPGLAGHDTRRPPEAEAAAIDTLLAALDAHVAAHGRPPFRVHVAHVSTAEAVARLERRDDVTFGVTPHHLLLDHGMDLGARGRVNPPLRSIGHAAVLWDAFTNDLVPVLESDHAPHTVADKARPVAAAPSGLPGVETMLPLMMARVALGQLSLDTLFTAAADVPARLMGLPKGRVEAGLHADIAVYDLEAVVPVAPDRLHSRAGWTPFAGLPASFPSHVWVRGRPVVAEGALVGPAGLGTAAVPHAEVR